jgi:ribosomal protein S18 acetylase RimI-like enzyme
MKISAAYRPATVRDAAFISRLVISSWQDAYRGFLPAAFLASLDRNSHHDLQAWESRITKPGSVTWIISDAAGSNVGMLRMTIGRSSIPGTDSELNSLYLLPQARGQGLGSETVVCARAQASRRAAGVLGVCVLAGNKRGHRFLRTTGSAPDRQADRLPIRGRADNGAAISARLSFRRRSLQAPMAHPLRCRSIGWTCSATSSDEQKHRPLPFIDQRRPCRDLLVGRTPLLDMR